MKKTRIQCFNLIEVVLAMGVIAIAISCIMGLIPVALNANRTAVSENCMASAADLVKAYADSVYAENGFSAFKNTFPAVKPVDAAAANIKATGSNLLGGATAAALYKLASPASGSYYLTLSSGDAVDFAAQVKIWRMAYSSDDKMYIPPVNGTDIDAGTVPSTSGEALGGGGKVYSGTDISDDNLVKVMVEIGYPAEASEENRECTTLLLTYAPKEL